MADSTNNYDGPVLEIQDLCLSYFTRAGEIPAVVDFSATLAPGESIGLVGESGCGKSTVAMAIMRYMGGNGDIVGGTVKFKGRDMATLSDEELRRIRGSFLGGLGDRCLNYQSVERPDPGCRTQPRCSSSLHPGPISRLSPLNRRRLYDCP